MIDYTPIFNAVILLISAAITAVGVPLLKAKLGSIKYDKFLSYVTIAVQAAEQLYPSNNANEKKRYVYEYIKGCGFDFDDESINTAIESAVLSLHNALYGVIE